MKNPLIARFANEPALLAPGSEDIFQAHLTTAASHPMLAQVQQAGGECASDDFWTELGRASAVLRPYNVRNGVLLVPVKGVLLQEFPYALFDYATGYEYIQKAIERGVGDDNVKGIALVVNSPGGMVAGCFDCVDRVYGARSVKPVRAFAAEAAYSAAYALFSAAEHGTVARTGGVGSIGVVTSHLDASKMMDEIGFKVTFIYAGKHKVDGNPYEPLPDDVKARIQARIDHLYGVFVTTVARNRGMDEQSVRATEALCFTAEEAVSNGLADEIGSLDDAVAAFAAELSPKNGEDEMSTPDNTAVDRAAHDQAVSAARAEGHTAGAIEGATAERARVKAILEHAEADGRSTLAQHFAFNTSMSPDEAAAALAAAPKEATSDGLPSFDAAMAGNNPNVGTGNDADADAAADGSDVIALARSMGLPGVRRAAN